MTNTMRRLLAGIAAVVAVVAFTAAPATADPPAQNPSNWGQCIQQAHEFGINPSLGAPGRVDHDIFPGPAVVLYNADGTIRATHWAQGFTSGVACTIPGFPNDIADIAASGPIGPSCVHAGVGCPETVAFYLATTSP